MSGLFYCPRCGERKAIWMNDFSFEDCGRDGDGIVTFYSCSGCNSDIEVSTPFEDEDDENIKE